MAIHLIGAMLYLGEIPDRTRGVTLPYLSPMSMDPENEAAFLRDGEAFVEGLSPVSLLTVLAGTHPRPTFRMTITIDIPNADDKQSIPLELAWGPKGYLIHTLDLEIRNVVIDGTFEAIPIRLLVEGEPLAVVKIPLRLPVKEQQ